MSDARRREKPFPAQRGLPRAFLTTTTTTTTTPRGAPSLSLPPPLRDSPRASLRFAKQARAVLKKIKKIKFKFKIVAAARHHRLRRGSGACLRHAVVSFLTTYLRDVSSPIWTVPTRTRRRATRSPSDRAPSSPLESPVHSVSTPLPKNQILDSGAVRDGRPRPPPRDTPLVACPHSTHISSSPIWTVVLSRATRVARLRESARDRIHSRPRLGTEFNGIRRTPKYRGASSDAARRSARSSLRNFVENSVEF